VQTVIVTALRRVGCITPMNTGSAMIASKTVGSSVRTPFRRGFTFPDGNTATAMRG
jgi:hypothetical protein